MKRMPLLRFSVRSTPLGRVESDLEVGVVADDHVNDGLAVLDGDAVGQVDNRACGIVERACPWRPGGR